MSRTKVVLVSIGLFFFFLLFSFPYENLKGHLFNKIYKESKILISADSMHPTFLGWPGLSFRNVDVTFPLSNLRVKAEKLVVRAGLGKIWPPSPSFSLSLSKVSGGGELFVRYAPSAQEYRVYLESESLSLKSLLSEIGEPVQGILNLKGHLVLNPNNLSTAEGSLKMDVSDIQTSAQNLQGILLPVLRIGNLDAEVLVQKGVVTFKKANFGDKKTDLSGQLTGSVQLGNQWEESQVNAVLRLVLAENYSSNERLSSLQTLVNTMDLFGFRAKNVTSANEFAMRWKGSVEMIMQNPAPFRVEDTL